MAKIFITGHRNPDMDSVCSAYAYAQLLNARDHENTYIPVRCGNLNEATKAAFRRIGVTPPAFIRDVRSRLSEVVRHGETTLDWQDPIYKLVSLFSSNPSAVAVLKEGRYYGLLSMDEVNRFFLRENGGGRPSYHFVVDNIPKVIRGRFLKRGRQDSFDGPLFIGAMRSGVFSARLDALSGPLPLLVVGDREEHIRKAVERQVPCIILTGLEKGMRSRVDFSPFLGTVFVSEEDTSETVRLLRLTVPVARLFDEEPPRLEFDMLFDEAKNILKGSAFRGMPVFDGEEWKGFVTRRCFLEKPKTKVILVDHNEKEQSVPGLEEAEIVEIVDHHRLGATRTPNPISVCCDPVGSTCTIIHGLFRRRGVVPSRETARLLLSGLVSDTVMLKSPTTTDVDRKAAVELCRAGGVDDFDAFARELFSASSSLSGKDALTVVESDLKLYEERHRRFCIGQCEVTTLTQVDELKERYLRALEAEREKKGLDFAMLMITDVIHEDSILLASGMEAHESRLAYEKRSPHMFLLPGVLSRKKQLLPEILRVLEEG